MGVVRWEGAESWFHAGVMRGNLHQDPLMQSPPYGGVSARLSQPCLQVCVGVLKGEAWAQVPASAEAISVSGKAPGDHAYERYIQNLLLYATQMA